MAKSAMSASLQTAIRSHLEKSKAQVERLDQAFTLLGEKPQRKKCQAMEGLIEEGKEVIEKDGLPEVMDAALIGAAQRVEHYEMAGYGTARALAETLSLSKVAKLLQETHDEEGEADKTLNELAIGEVSEAAFSVGS